MNPLESHLPLANPPYSANAAALRVESRIAMATRFTLYLREPDEARAREIGQAVFEEIARIEDTFSRFKPASEISRINREAAAGPMVTDPEVFRLLTVADDLTRKTGGVFDIALGRLSRAWGFADRQPAMPETAALAEAQAHAGWQHVRLDPTWRTVEFLTPGIELDLGGLAKGYALDCALGVLRTAGVSGVIDAGSSSIAATDAVFGSEWRVSIGHPLEDGKILAGVQLGARALATSGVKEQRLEADGRLFSHILDRRKEEKRPRCQVLQVSVLAPTSTLADGLSTALFLLGPEPGREVLRDFPDCAAFWVCGDANAMSCESVAWPLPGVGQRE